MTLRRRFPSVPGACPLATGFLALSLGLPAAAQTAPFIDRSATHLPPGLAGACMDAAAGDADGDGDPDLALAMEFQRNRLLLNDGAGRFTDGSERLPPSEHDSEDIAFADFDEDGWPDLVLVSEDDRRDELYLNDGTGRFLDASERLQTDDVSNALAVLDLDGDGHLDLLTGNIGTDRVLLGDGQGRFVDATAQRWPQGGDSRTQDLEPADVDADGDQDLLVANEGQNHLFLNEAGVLRDATAGRLPAQEDETREIRAADLDGDGDLDLAVANVRFLRQDSPQDYLLLNDGQGVFTRADGARFPEDARSNFTIQALDLDRDGDQDILAPSTVFGEGDAEFLALVRDARTGSDLIIRSASMNLHDADADGDVDMDVDAGGSVRILRNEAGRLMLEAGLEERVSAQPVDLDGNGETDLSFSILSFDRLMGAADAEAGDYVFQQPQVQLIDLGEDGGVDVVVAQVQRMAAVGDTLVLLNDGNGAFSARPSGSILPASLGNTFDVEVADFDADGLRDLFFCNRASLSASPAASGGLQRLLFGRP